MQFHKPEELRGQQVANRVTCQKLIELPQRDCQAPKLAVANTVSFIAVEGLPNTTAGRRGNAEFECRQTLATRGIMHKYFDGWDAPLPISGEWKKPYTCQSLGNSNELLQHCTS